MSYELRGDAWVTQRQIAGGPTITFEARDVRKERTGVHAALAILANTTVLAYTTQNVERNDERVTLANSAYSQLTDNLNGTTDAFKALYPKAHLKHDLDLFCRGLWEQENARFDPVAVEGTEARPPAYVVDPFIVEQGGTIVFAPPGQGKSFMTMTLAVSCDAGITTSAWQIPTARPTLFINLERSAVSVATRLGAVNRALGLPSNRKLSMIQGRGHTLREVHARAARWVVEHPDGVIFLDSLSRAGAGDLNENQAGNAIVDLLNALGTWLAIAHTPRGDESHVFGSQMFDAGCDLRVKLTSQQEPGGPLGIGLALEKHNDTPAAPQVVLAYEFGPLGLTAIRPAKTGEFPDVEANKKVTLGAAVRDYLLSVGKATATEIAEETGFNRTNISTLLNRDASFTRVERVGPKIYYGVRGQ